jgi:hypothetical protein
MNLSFEIELKNQTREHSENYNVAISFIYSIFVLIGTLGNAFVIACYYRNFKKNPTYLPFILLSIAQVSILYMNSSYFIKIDQTILLKSEHGCLIFNFIYGSFLLIEPW